MKQYYTVIYVSPPANNISLTNRSYLEDPNKF